MPRSGKIVRDRLQQAALELFAEHGYDDTTAERIAERAGVTERTYFRHFVDKREVLFGGEAELRTELERAMARVPADRGPLATLRTAFHEVVPLLVRNRPVAEPRARVIAATPALHERELAKGAALVVLLTDALVARGTEAGPAGLCAQVGMDVFGIATRRWMDDPSADLPARIDEAFAELRGAAHDLGSLGQNELAEWRFEPAPRA